MSDAWRIFVVDEDEALNQHIVNTLCKDGYVARGVLNGADAVRMLWSEEFHVVLCDLKAPGADSFELLQWLRAYRPATQMMMVGPPGSSSSQRVLALESGAVCYLEKPLDLRLLKDELRRLQQQSGFTASLDSFDLLDVIQIINMSHKSITLLINTGLEERGLLRFHNGELIWAEYGILRGEEAFFALAAHKNGTVTQQFWDEQVTANVSQPLSRLIFQALQYRTKYADRQQYTGEMEPLNKTASSSPLLDISDDEIDDTPFVMFDEEEAAPVAAPAMSAPVFEEPLQPTSHLEPVGKTQNEARPPVPPAKEWWQRTGQITRVTLQSEPPGASPPGNSNKLEGTPEPSPVVLERPIELPSWLTDQPTTSQPVLQPAPLNIAQPTGKVPATPRLPATSGEWHVPLSPAQGKTTDDFSLERQMSPPVTRPFSAQDSALIPAVSSPSSATWQPVPEQRTGNHPPVARFQNEVPKASVETALPAPVRKSDPLQDSSPLPTATAALRAQQPPARRNYPALVSALQTLGYSITGFIAAAVVSLDGQAIAQVAVDDLDISRICKHFSAIQRGVMQALVQGDDGDYEETVITSSKRNVLMRAVGSDTSTFLVLITTREASPSESLEVMANVEGAISAALR